MNVTSILVPCILANQVELVAGGAAFTNGGTASDTWIVQVRPNTEP